ncbi:hypothetical protein VTN00DRAFT_10224 [Thermoascus crustaceus]|uniref:uncharacterized protein n=1 Tax=Thermoascus crustaceus TaxID=5088 RepID=UPI0037440C4E
MTQHGYRDTQQTAYRSFSAGIATARREWPAELASGAVPAGRPTGSAAGLHPRVSTADPAPTTFRLMTAASSASYAVLRIFFFDNSFSIHNDILNRSQLKTAVETNKNADSYACSADKMAMHKLRSRSKW